MAPMKAQSYFTPELFTFLRQLKRNNTREWFQRNKERYQAVVVEPALRFISDMAEPLAKLAPHLVADARPSRGSLFRIYRDTRFGADKTPYKTHVGLHFAHEAGKDVHAPLFYLHLEPGGSFAGGGVWHPDSAALTKIRTAIVANPAGWKKARGKLDLVGDSLSRAPKGFPCEHPFLDDLKRKDFVAITELSEEQLCGAQLLKQYGALCKSFAPLVEFTTRALGLKF